MFPDNDWYSNKKILFDFCGIKKTFPIWATLQHGWFYSYDKNTIKQNNNKNKVYNNKYRCARRVLWCCAVGAKTFSWHELNVKAYKKRTKCKRL